MGTIDSHRKAAEEAGRRARELEKRARSIDHWSAKLFTFVTDIEVKDESAPIRLSAKEFVVAVGKHVLLELTGAAALKYGWKLLKWGGKKLLRGGKGALGKGGKKAGKASPKKPGKAAGKGGKPKAPSGKAGKPAPAKPPAKPAQPKGPAKPPPRGPARTARTNGARPAPKPSPPAVRRPPIKSQFMEEFDAAAAGRKVPWRPTRNAYELAAAHGSTPAQVNARRVVAGHFYREYSGIKDGAEIASHLKGIDFTKPVSVGPPPALPAKLVQHVYPNTQGKYFGMQTGLKPTDFGVEAARLNRNSGLFEQRVETLIPVNPGKDPLGPAHLRSTSEGVVTSWTNPPWQTKGGADQIYIPEMKPASAPVHDYGHIVHGPSAPPRPPTGPSQAPGGPDLRFGPP